LGLRKLLSSLADLPEIIGFFSYSRDDDTDSIGALSALRGRIQRELRGRLGRTRANFRLWQDTAAIPQGALWEDEIKSAIAQSVFFIPIITPTTIRSPHCKHEFELFLAREAELGRRNLIFPLLYIRVPELENERQWRQDEVLNVVGTRQYLDWQERRYLDVNSTEVAVRIGRFCSNIYDALQQPQAGAADASRNDPPRVKQKGEEGAQPLAFASARLDDGRAVAPRQLPDPAVPARAGGSGIRRTIGTGIQFALVGLVGALAVAVFVLWRQTPTPPPQLPLAIPANPPAPSAPASGTASSTPPTTPAAPSPAPVPAADPDYAIRRSGSFGGPGGSPFDDLSANPRHLPMSALYITVTQNPGNRNEKLIGRLQAQWGDTLAPLHGGGPSDVPALPAQFTKDERIDRIFVFHMNFSWARNEVPPVWIAGLQVHTNKGFYNFGYTDGPSDVCAIASGETIIGFFGRSGSYLDQLGCIFGKPK
jgi:TIR domain/Jacalin-like lectin domain